MTKNLQVADRIRDTKYRTFNKELAHYLGLKESIYIAYLVDQDFYFNRLNVGQPFYKQQKYITLETTISSEGLRLLNKKFIELGLLTIKKLGMPAKNYFTINYEVLEQLLNESIEHFSNMLNKCENTTKNDSNESDNQSESSPNLGEVANPNSGHIINNKYINNKNTISKDIDEQENCSSNEKKNVTKNNELLVKLYKQNETENSNNTKVDTSSNNSSKGKGGLKPLIDLANDKFPKEQYPDVNSKLVTYLKCYLGCRRLPTLEKWEDMLFRLKVYSSVEIPGTSGSKFLNSRAIEIVEKAIYGKNGAPYLDFDNLYGVKEPHLNSNQNLITGF